MKRNLFIAILTPCILACILFIFIILDNRDSDQKVNQSDNGNETVVDTIDRNDSATALPTLEQDINSKSTPVPTLDGNSTQLNAPTASPTPVSAINQTKAPTTNPMKTPTVAPTSAPTNSPTPTLAASLDSTQTSPVSAPSEKIPEDITGTSKEPSHTSGITEQNQDNSNDGVVEDQNLDTYNAIYTQEGDAFTLVGDSITDFYLLIDNQNNTIRKTAFKYAPYFKDVPGNFCGPIFGYKNKTFIFMAENQLVASDGMSETVLKTFETDFPFINPIVESENRYMAGIGGVLVVIDTRTLLVETYHQQYSVDFFVFTDEYLCFSNYGRIPASGYFNTLYTAKEGNIKLHGIIGEIDEYVLDSDTVTIKSQNDLYQINLKDDVLTTTKQTYREYMLYTPVYSTSCIRGLSDMRFINYNMEDAPVQSIQLPNSWDAECYYFLLVEPSMSYFYKIHDRVNERLLPHDQGCFTLIDVDATTYPFEDGKYIANSTFKKNCIPERLR